MNDTRVKQNAAKLKGCMKHRASGMAMLMVLVAVGVASILGLSFLASSTTTTGVVKIMDDHARARQIAESGLQLGRSYLEHSPQWMQSRENGIWVSQFPLFDGQVTLQASFDPDPPATAMDVTNHSFENATGKLSNGILGLVAPALWGNIGGWTVKRGGLLGGLLSTTVPNLEVLSHGAATDGSRLARVEFKAGVLAFASFARTIPVQLEPQTTYTLKLDVGKAGIIAVLPSHSLKVSVAGQMIAMAGDGQLIDLLDLDGNFQTRGLRFTTPADVPEGDVHIEIYTQTVLTAAQGIGFDNVRLEKNRPVMVTLTATAIYGQASHVVSASIMPMGSQAPAKIVTWRDP